MDHWDERCKDTGVMEMVRYVAIYCRAKLGLWWVTDTDVCHAYGVLKTNAVGHDRQCFLYPTVSLLSHSCAPNMEMVGIPGKTVQMVATRNIKEGEELTWSYCDIMRPKHHIQTTLRKIWKFDCKCSRCLDRTELGLHYSSMKCECGGYYSVVTTRQVTCDSCDRGRVIEDYRDQEDRLAREVTEAPENQLTNILQIFSTNVALHPIHYVLVKLYIRLIDSGYSLSEECSSYLRKALEKLAGEGSALYRK